MCQGYQREVGEKVRAFLYRVNLILDELDKSREGGQRNEKVLTSLLVGANAHMKNEKSEPDPVPAPDPSTDDDTTGAPAPASATGTPLASANGAPAPAIKVEKVEVGGASGGGEALPPSGAATDAEEDV